MLLKVGRLKKFLHIRIYINIYYLKLQLVLNKNYSLFVNFIHINSICSSLFVSILRQLHFFIIQINIIKQKIVIVIKIIYKNKLDFVVDGEFVVVIRGIIVVVELEVVVVTSWHNLGITQSESNLLNK